MNRDSKDILDPEGFIFSGYDYQLQVWVKNGQIEPCGHPLAMRTTTWCCNQNHFAGLFVKDIPQAEKISEEMRKDRDYPWPHNGLRCVEGFGDDPNEL